MKKLLCMFLFSLVFLFAQTQTFAEERESIGTLFESVPIDEEHLQIFDDVMIEFLDKNWEVEKTFPDGDSLFQTLHGIKLARIDSLPNNIDRYVTYLTFHVRRYSKEYAQYTEEFLLQPLYLDINKNTKKLVNWTAFETIDLNILLKKEI